MLAAEKRLRELVWKEKDRLSNSGLLQAQRLVREAIELLKLVAEAGAFRLDDRGAVARLIAEADDILETANADAAGPPKHSA